MKELTEAVGVAGYEGEVAKIMERHLSSVADISYDKLGSFIAKKVGKKDGPKVMLAAHMDEIGFMVKKITKEGFIEFLPLGGWWSHVLLSQRMLVRASKGDILGVVVTKPPHELRGRERRRLLEVRNMYIDVGSTSDFNLAEKLGIHPGDPIVPVSQFTIMNNPKLYLAKAWDDRVGCALIIDVILRLAQIAHPNIVYGVGTVQEEVGLRGAATSASCVEPDLAIALDVSVARDTPDMGRDLKEVAEKLGAGPAILVYDRTMIPNIPLRNLVAEIAKEKKIPYHFTTVEGGYDTGRIHTHKEGVPSVAIGIPTRYIHGHVGIIHRGDYDQAVKLILALIQKLDARAVKRLSVR